MKVLDRFGRFLRSEKCGENSESLLPTSYFNLKVALELTVFVGVEVVIEWRRELGQGLMLGFV